MGVTRVDMLYAHSMYKIPIFSCMFNLFCKVCMEGLLHEMSLETKIHFPKPVTLPVREAVCVNSASSQLRYVLFFRPFSNIVGSGHTQTK